MTDLISQWEATKKQLEILRKEEVKLRKQLINEYFPQYQEKPVEGAQNVQIDKQKLTCTAKYTRKIDTDALTFRWTELVNQGIPMHSLVVNRPTLSLTAYRKLSEEQLNLFDELIETKCGLPTLTIKRSKK